jgi:hypothetical protein
LGFGGLQDAAVGVAGPTDVKTGEGRPFWGLARRSEVGRQALANLLPAGKVLQVLHAALGHQLRIEHDKEMLLVPKRFDSCHVAVGTENAQEELFPLFLHGLALHSRKLSDWRSRSRSRD